MEYIIRIKPLDPKQKITKDDQYEIVDCIKDVLNMANISSEISMEEKEEDILKK